MMNQPDAQCLGGGKALAGQGEATERPRADAVDEQRYDRRGGNSPAHLADREDGVLGGNRNVASSGDPDPAAKAAAMNHRQGRAGEMAQAVHRSQGAARKVEILPWRRRAQVTQKGKVGPGLEMPPRTAQYDATQAWLALEAGEGVDQPVDQRPVISVADRGPVERDRGNTAGVDRIQHRVVAGHGRA